VQSLFEHEIPRDEASLFSHHLPTTFAEFPAGNRVAVADEWWPPWLRLCRAAGGRETGSGFADE